MGCVGVSTVKICKLSKGQRLFGLSIICVQVRGLPIASSAGSSASKGHVQEGQEYPSLLLVLLPPMHTKGGLFQYVKIHPHGRLNFDSPLRKPNWAIPVNSVSNLINMSVIDAPP